MKIWVVYSEFNRGYDCDGSAVVDSVHTTAEGAEAGAKIARATWRDMNIPIYADPDTDEGDEDDDDWGVDVHVEAFEVQP